MRAVTQAHQAAPTAGIPDAAGRWPRALALVATAAVGVTIAGLLVAWPWTGFAATWRQWAGRPYASMLPWLAAYLGIATFGGGRRRAWWRLAAAAMLVGVWSTFRVLSMGDDHWWRKATADGVFTWAEPLSSVLHAIAYRTLGAGSIEWLAVACGWLATVAWLAVTDRLLDGARGRWPRFAAAAVWVASGVCGTFFARYVEHSQIGVPLLVLGLGNLTAWSRAVAASPPTSAARGALLVGAAQLTLAALMHLQYVGMLVAAVAAALLVGARRGVLATLADGVRLILLVGAMLAATVVLLRALPFRPFVGSVAGGADGRLLVPFCGDGGSWFAPGCLLAADHLAVVATILAFAAPLALPAMAMALWPRGRGLDLVLAATGLAYVVFVVAYGFDLGWPTDLDLMMAMSPGLTLSVVVAIARAANGWSAPVRAGCAVLLLAAIWSTWSMIGPLVRPIGADLCQQNSASAALVVDGHGVTGRGPFLVEGPADSELTLVAHGPPGAPFWILRGVPHPVFSGFPYGSVSDIELPEGLAPDAFVHVGTLDDSGRAEVKWRVVALADGSLPGLQMLVMQTGDGPRSVASSAFYLVE